MVIPELIHATYIPTAGVSFSCSTLRFSVRTNAFIRPNHRECVDRRIYAGTYNISRSYIQRRGGDRAFFARVLSLLVAYVFRDVPRVLRVKIVRSSRVG